MSTPATHATSVSHSSTGAMKVDCSARESVSDRVGQAARESVAYAAAQAPDRSIASRFDESDRIRQEGHEYAARAERCFEKSLDAGVDKHYGEATHQFREGWKESRQARELYSEANKVMMEASRDQAEAAREERGGGCLVV